MMFARVDITGKILSVTRGNPDWPSVGQGEWVPYPLDSVNWLLRYNRTTKEFV